VLMDVPKACAGANSSCPVLLMLHGHNGHNDGFAHTNQSLVFEYSFIGLYPQGEMYEGLTGWNDGSMDGLTCAYDDYTCTQDPNDGLFIAKILSTVKGLGALGRVYAYGTSNGANEVQILASNAVQHFDALPIVGIATRSGQLLSAPARSAANPYNYNQPCAGDAGCTSTRKMAQLSMHGTADTIIPYTGGSRFGSDVFTLMDEKASDELWATQNGCEAGKIVSSNVSATYPSETGTDVSSTATHFVWTGCPSAAPIELYKVWGAPHGAADTLEGKNSQIVVFDFFNKVEMAHGGVRPPVLPWSPPRSPFPPSSEDTDAVVEDALGTARADNAVADYGVAVAGRK